MKEEILYRTALNIKGDLIHVLNAKKGIDYFCPDCKREFVLKKSGNTGKGSKRPHFAHKSDEVDFKCSPESVLHKSFKKLVVEFLNSYLFNNKKIDVVWGCTSCKANNKGSLLYKVDSIREEYNLGVCRPDIALLDEEQNIVAVIEIVVTHAPEESALHYYQDNKITLFQIHLESDEDLLNVESKLTRPDYVGFCFNPRCQNTNSYSIERGLQVVHARCGKCNQLIKKSHVIVSTPFGEFKSLDFTDSEIKIIQANFPDLRLKVERATNKRYFLSDCINCKRIKSKYGRSRRF
jgi:ribosomal protein L37AE/L43A